MPQLAEKAAAYTRTGILNRFLEALSESEPPRVDADYATDRLKLKGGDVRAFLQSLRVLGFVDPYGKVTERGRRTRSPALRPTAIREGLTAAYPELVELWNARGGSIGREELEGEFKFRYGLSATSTGPAAKLFMDLMRDYVRAPQGSLPAESPGESADVASPKQGPAAVSPEVTVIPSDPTAAGPREVRIDAGPLQARLNIDINSDWDAERIQLVFDRVEGLMKALRPV